MTRSKPAVLTITVLMAFASGPIRAGEGASTTSARGASLQREADARSAVSVRVRGATTDTELGAASTGEPVPTIVYRPPRRGSPVSTVGGGSRGSIALPAPLALAPGHVAHTSRPRPDLFWYIDAAAPERTRVFFSLVNRTALETTTEFELERPPAAGIYRVRLSEHRVELEPEVEYAWSIALVEDLERRSRDAVTTGYIRRVEEPRLAGGPLDARAYAELGLWYDALESLSNAIDAAPHNEALRRQRGTLLDQAELAIEVK